MKKNNFFSLALLTGCLFASTSAMAQDKTVTMTTAKTAGSSMTLMVNHTSNGVTVDWGDNNPQTYKSDDILNVITGTVKGPQITITGDETWEMLSCANCELTNLDLTGARTLVSLYCQNNQLTGINLKGMSSLTDLNCSNNQISSITYTSPNNPGKDLAVIEYFNIANNRLAGTFRMGAASAPLKSLQQVNISDNNFDNMILRYAPGIRTFKASRNQLEKADFSYNTSIAEILLNNNQINVERSGNNRYSLRFPKGGIVQVVVDNNQIDSLSLAGHTTLRTLSCKNNNMAVLDMPAIPEGSPMSVLDVCNNKLNFNVLPPYSNKPTFCQFLPQDSIDLFTEPCVVTTEAHTSYIPVCPNYADRNDAAYALDLDKYRAVGVTDETPKGSASIRTTFTWYAINDNNEATALVKGTSTDADYSYASGVTTFYKPQKRVYAVLKQGQYNYELCTNSIAIGEENASVPSGIHAATTTDGNGLDIHAGNGCITLSSAAPVGVRIFSVNGKAVWGGMVGAGSTTISLSKGIYLVNGKKVIL